MATTDFARMAKDSGHKSLKDMNITQDELAKIEAAFQKPEFMDMFREYVKEISDPKALEENDLYIRQLEAEGRVEEVYGKGVQVVLPEAAFVIKTASVSTKEKVFINVCTSDKVEEMSITQEKGPDGKTGTRVQIPMTYSKEAKKGTDRHGSPCSVWDVAVHPACISAAGARPALLTTLSEMAIEKLEESGLKLSRHFKHPKMKYKTTPGHDKPHAMAIRAPAATSNSKHEAFAGAPAAWPGSSTSSTSTSVSEPEDKTEARSKFVFPSAAASSQERKRTDITTPDFRLIHRGVMDLAEAWGDVGRNLHYNTCLPKDLLLRVSLPGVVTAANIQLDIAEKEVQLTVEGTYALKTSLPYKIDDAKAKAKFDKHKEQLELTLPVLPPPLIPMGDAKTTQPDDAALPATPPLPASPAADITQPEPEAHPVATASQETSAAVITQPKQQPAAAAAAVAPAGQAVELLQDANSSTTASATVSPGAHSEQHSTAAVPGDLSSAGATSTAPAQTTGPTSAAEQQGGKALSENERKWMALHVAKSSSADASNATVVSSAAGMDSRATTDLACIRDVQSNKATGDAVETCQPAAKAMPAAADTYTLKPRVSPAMVEELD